ncbi:MAG TPA: methyltransferase domain-containing protein [Pseudolabrys sp.]
MSTSPIADPVTVSSREPPAEGLKLHIGGQEKREGWAILDALPGPIVDYVGNCSDMSFLADESCSEVYASHVLEHLGYNGELQKTIKAIYRVLKPNGRLRVSVPDLETLCRLFLHPSLNGPGRFHVMRMMFGGRINEFDVHYVGLNFEFLGEFLHEGGFRDIRRVPNFGLFNDTSKLMFGDVPISLNVEARK